MQAAKWAALCLVVQFLSGCAGSPAMQVASLQRGIPPEEAFVMPPPGGPAIVSVLQKKYANGIEQNILLATHSRVAGQNRIRVRLSGKVDNSAQAQTSFETNVLALNDPSRDAFRELPGIAMRRAPFFVKNRYGPFGYSVGRRGGDMCLYGWQQLRAEQAIIGPRGYVDIRVRYCRTGASERQLLGLMYGYSISGYLGEAGWDPYGKIGSPAPDLSEPGTNVYPDGGGSFLTVLPEPAPARRTMVRREALAPTRPAPAESAPRGPVVPPPPESGNRPIVPAPPPATQ